MTFAGYAGMLATLAFVLGLVMLVARLAKRFLPGAVQASGGDSFSVVQRIPLGQRQGIAIVQRGDLLIGVSVGEGGVRTLFTVPNASSTLATVPELVHGDEHDIDDRSVLPI
ncbi:MAG TPA: flagellar biosynthetic protein FliO, partial [Gemmatimonadaceae bacterium]|nr:flagellar biosynthetic protein FliO [Gemmatimonadaceae bacterium]